MAVKVVQGRLFHVGGKPVHECILTCYNFRFISEGSEDIATKSAENFTTFSTIPLSFDTLLLQTFVDI